MRVIRLVMKPPGGQHTYWIIADKDVFFLAGASHKTKKHQK